MKKIILFTLAGIIVLPTFGAFGNPNGDEPLTPEEHARLQRIMMLGRPGGETPHGVHYSNTAKSPLSTRGSTFYYAPSSDRK
jgi:hypothetical protein